MHPQPTFYGAEGEGGIKVIAASLKQDVSIQGKEEGLFAVERARKALTIASRRATENAFFD
jgi:hypothetical protein